MIQNVAYYSDDITLLPAKAIWSFCRQASWLAPFYFALYYFLKRINFKAEAAYGIARPDELTIVRTRSLSVEEQDAFAPYFDTLNAQGYTYVFSSISPFIGSKSEITAVFLGSDGQSYVTLVRTKTKQGSAEDIQTGFGCHSFLTKGIWMTSAPVENALQFDDIFPPEITIAPLGLKATLEDVIVEHQRQLSSTSVKSQQFDVDSLSHYMMRAGQLAFDHLVKKKYCHRLSDAEVNRLIDLQSN